MKNLLLILSLITSFSVLAENCTIHLKKKKTSAKTAYTLSGDTISNKVAAKLSSQCEFKYSLFSTSELKAMKIAKLKKQLAKLRDQK